MDPEGAGGVPLEDWDMAATRARKIAVISVTTAGSAARDLINSDGLQRTRGRARYSARVGMSEGGGKVSGESHLG